MKSTFQQQYRHLLALSALLVAPTAFVSASTIVVQDDMSAPNYSSFSFNSATLGGGTGNPDDISSESATSIGSGGNAGPYLEVTHHHDVDRDGNGAPLNGDGSTFVQSFFKQQTVTYDPSIQGGISTITFSIDLLIATTPPAAPFSQIFFAIDDALGGNAAGFISLPPNTSGWQTFSTGPLTQADFSGRNFNGSNPFKFSFGFTSSADVTPAPRDLTIGADNFVVTVAQVPEPTSAALLGASILAAGCIRRRRSGSE